MRTGVGRLDNFGARGRKKTEEKALQLVEQLERIVEPHAQADPKFQTPLAYTRITANAVREELLKNDELRVFVPSRQTVGEILNRMGYRLRRVVKTRLEKRSPKQMTSSRTSRLVAARQDTSCLRISLDSKAQVKVGPFSRRGQSRGQAATKAGDHDMGATAVLLLPIGILEVSRGPLSNSICKRVTTWFHAVALYRDHVCRSWRADDQRRHRSLVRRPVGERCGCARR